MRKYPLINLNCRWRFRPASIQPLAYRAVLYREIPLRMKKNVPTDTSKFAAEILNAALKMSLEWGENWLAPIHQRIQKAYPKLSAEEADSLNLWCIEVRKYAFALVEEEYPLALANIDGTAMERVKQKYPQIDGENLSQLYNQGMYYAWHG